MKIILAGATGDIGTAIAQKLYESGHELFLLYRDKQKLECLLARLRAEHKISSFPLSPLDLGNLEKELRVFKPDVFITALGDGYYNKIENISLDELDSCYVANFRLNFALIQKSYQIFLAQKKGHIILINSVSGLEGFPYGGMYCSFKFALRGLAEVLYKEGKRYNIRVSSIYPGVVKTKLLHKMPFKPKEKDCILPKDIAKAVEFILNQPLYSEIKDLVIKNNSLHWGKN